LQELSFEQKSQLFLNNFMQNYYHKLRHRSNSFLNAFKYLISLKKDSYFIVETGMCRIENNFDGDGMSTILWDEFINIFGGKVYSVDILQVTVNFTKNKVSNLCTLFCQDSVSFLHQLSLQENLSQIDLLYLDSFDLDCNNPHPSSFHHMKEFLAIKSKINSGCLILIDDNNRNLGKGRYVDEFMTNIQKQKIIDEYQIAWIW
jgi:hypothetical protein